VITVLRRTTQDGYEFILDGHRVFVSFETEYAWYSPQGLSATLGAVLFEHVARILAGPPTQAGRAAQVVDGITKTVLWQGQV